MNLHESSQSPSPSSQSPSSNAGSYKLTGAPRDEDLVSMNIEDLLWIPSIAKLYHEYNELKDYELELSATQSRMHNDVARLLEARHKAACPKHDSNQLSGFNTATTPSALRSPKRIKLSHTKPAFGLASRKPTPQGRPPPSLDTCTNKAESPAGDMNTRAEFIETNARVRAWLENLS